MEIAHGGHECDGTAFATPLIDLLTQRGGIINDQHQEFTFRYFKERWNRPVKNDEAGACAPAIALRRAIS
ncbi:hypothetical protein D3C72_2474370 [compost metagenome]